MKKIEKICCSNCGVKNDIIFYTYNDNWKVVSIRGTDICWYCKKPFSWIIENKNYAEK
jgi:hypothetical protein